MNFRIDGADNINDDLRDISARIDWGSTPARSNAHDSDSSSISESL
jgi:hypothetical protein